MRDAEFERLYEEHASSLLSFLAYRTGERALAEDLLADTFERVLRSRKTFDRTRGSEKTWIYTIALNCLRGYYRRRRAEGRAIDCPAHARPTRPPGAWRDVLGDGARGTRTPDLLGAIHDACQWMSSLNGSSFDTRGGRE